ncbi:MAG: hypothetical protein D6692_07200 [Planctomycetota bacterium]|nr:MAG: hypothetical protein D6692_07200 [Planctomycetota bacterium]
MRGPRPRRLRSGGHASRHGHRRRRYLRRDARDLRPRRPRRLLPAPERPGRCGHAAMGRLRQADRRSDPDARAR